MCAEGTLVAGGLRAFMGFAGQYYLAMSNLCLSILSAYAVVWMSWQFYKMAASIPGDLKQLVDDFTALVVVAVFLSVPSFVWEFYHAILSTGIWSAGKAFSVANGAATSSSLNELVCYGTRGIFITLYRTAVNALNTASIMQIGNLVWIILMLIPAALLMVRIVKHIAEPLVDASMILNLMPFVVLAAAIGPLRNAAAQSIKLMIVCVKELIVACVIVGVMINLIGKVSGLNPVQGDSMDVDAASGWLGSEGYLITIALMLFFFFAFDRATQVPARLLSIFAPSGIQFSVPKLPLSRK